MTTNEFDELGPEQDDPLAPSHEKAAKGKFVANMAEAWRTRPLFKLMVIMIVVAVAIVASLSFSSAPVEKSDSRLVRAPDLNEAPGGKASPYFIEQNKQAANQRVEDAMQRGGSALPTPVGQSVDMTEVEKKDPLTEFRAETERLKQELKQEQQHNSQQIQQIQQVQQQAQVQAQGRAAQPFDDSLAQAMQKQLQNLSDSWRPQAMKSVSGTGKGSSNPSEYVAEERAAANTGSANGTSSSSSGAGGMNGLTSGFGTPNNPVSQAASNAAAVQAINSDKLVVSAGTVSYGQLLTEANSDVPGTIMAQIVSGPFSGGRAIGEFTVQDDYIVLKFNLVNYKGRDYSVQILALNPNTTLGGMATEVDPRYVTRVLLPAAGEFVSAFGEAMSSTDTTTTVSSNAVISSSARKGFRQGLYQGIGKMGDTVSDFMKDQANKTKQLVRIASGTPLGLFFTQSIRENASQAAAAGTGTGPTLSKLLNTATSSGSNSGPYNLSTTGTSSGNSNSNVRIYGPQGTSYYNN